MSTPIQSPDDLRFGLMREWRFLLATFAATGVGYLGAAGAPFIIEALIAAGLSHSQAGDLGTIELSSLALVSLLSTPFVPYVSHRKLAVSGVLVTIVGLVISATSEAYLPMILGRIGIGTGSGLAIAAANATVAAREDAERIFAIIWTLGGGITAMLGLVLPRVVADGNYPMGFLTLLVLCLAALPCVFWIPHRPPSLAEETNGDASNAKPPLEITGASSTGRFGVFGPSAILVLLGIFVYSVAEMALWQFSYELAIDAGVPGDEGGRIISFTVAMGLVGGAIAAVLGTRLGRVFPIVIGTLLSTAGRWVFIGASGAEMLWAGGLLWGLGYYFVSPYQIGLAAVLDRRGRVAVASAAAGNLGFGLGPTIAGRVRQYEIEAGLDHTTLIFVIAGSTFLSLLLFLPVAYRIDRAFRARENPASAD